MTALVLLALSVVLMWPLPRLLARQHDWRRSPGAALVVWQLVSLSGVLAALAAGPAAIPALTGEGSNALLRTVVPVVAAAASIVVLARLLRAGHVVGRRLRSLRREHRQLVDLIGVPDDTLGPGGRVLDHPTPTAYCLPGIRRRVVLSRGTLDQLQPDQLEAVLAHERAHLTRRHDLVIEFFTVLHTAAPARVRSADALEEVRLLVEALADRSAVRHVGSLPLAHALVALASARSPEGGIASNGASAAARLRLIDRPAPWWMPPVMYAFGAVTVALPVALLALAWA